MMLRSRDHTKIWVCISSSSSSPTSPWTSGTCSITTTEDLRTPGPESTTDMWIRELAALLSTVRSSEIWSFNHKYLTMFQQKISCDLPDFSSASPSSSSSADSSMNSMSASLSLSMALSASLSFSLTGLAAMVSY